MVRDFIPSNRSNRSWAARLAGGSKLNSDMGKGYNKASKGT
jgi:hypothetical protein